MDHPCYSCGQSVEDGVPFCAHCRAPQIRVILPEPVTAPAGAGAELSGGRAMAGPAMMALTARAPGVFRPCALAALIAIALVLARLHPLVAAFSAGVLAVAFYRPFAPGGMSAGVGARVGAFAGMLFSIALGALGTVAITVLHKEAEARGYMLQAIQEAASRTADPQAAAIFDWMRSPSGIVSMAVLCFIFACIFFILAAGVGGALGSFLAGKLSKRGPE